MAKKGTQTADTDTPPADNPPTKKPATKKRTTGNKPAPAREPKVVRADLSPDALALLEESAGAYRDANKFNAADKELHTELMASRCMVHNGCLTHLGRAVVALG